jgi:hypothetical protein
MPSDLNHLVSASRSRTDAPSISGALGIDHAARSGLLSEARGSRLFLACLALLPSPRNPAQPLFRQINSSDCMRTYRFRNRGPAMADAAHTRPRKLRLARDRSLRLARNTPSEPQQEAVA